MDLTEEELLRRQFEGAQANVRILQERLESESRRARELEVLWRDAQHRNMLASREAASAQDL